MSFEKRGRFEIRKLEDNYEKPFPIQIIQKGRFEITEEIVEEIVEEIYPSEKIYLQPKVPENKNNINNKYIRKGRFEIMEEEIIPRTINIIKKGRFEIIESFSPPQPIFI